MYFIMIIYYWESRVMSDDRYGKYYNKTFEDLAMKGIGPLEEVACVTFGNRDPKTIGKI